MTKRMRLKRETEKARQFVTAAGRGLWIPRSVCKSVLKFAEEPGQFRLCEVVVEDWWWEKNGEEARERQEGQEKFKLT